MTANETIAKWLGWKQVTPAINPSPVTWWHDPKHPNETVRFPCPMFDMDDSAAIQLLPELVARRYLPELYYARDSTVWCFRIWKRQPDCPGGHYEVISFEDGKTIHEAITRALKILIERSEG